MSIFTLEMFPASEGDCLLLTYGEEGALRRVLIDGGRAGTWPVLRDRLATLPPSDRRLELLIVTHVDRDHIEGILRLAADTELGLEVGEVWFNGYDHLLEATTEESFGAVQGDELSKAIRQREWSWNQTFGLRDRKTDNAAVAGERRRGRAAAVEHASAPIVLAGGLELQLLSPSFPKLAKMIPRWEEECRRAGTIAGGATPEPEGLESFGAIDIERLAASAFESDDAQPNGTSIAVLATFDGRRVLLAADAHVDELARALTPLAQAAGGRLALDAFKIPHHGSRKNLSVPLLELVACPRYLVSTSGAYFKHPSVEAIARLIKHGGTDHELIFNYESSYTTPWNDPQWKSRYRYTVRYPASGSRGYVEIVM